MKTNNNKTIYALSTAVGKSGVAVIRVSGVDALKSVGLMTNIKKPKSRHTYFTTLKDAVSQETLDKSLVIYFENPNSFTGEDIVEYHIHGSKAVINNVINSLSNIENYYLAEPGEFTKRAFYNNKMDLTEVDALADLIDSETKAQADIALRQLEGNLKDLYEAWRKETLSMLAYIEAFIDFPEEELPEDMISSFIERIEVLKLEISSHLQDNNVGERLRDGFRVVVLGPPNSGKSSLLNRIVKRDAAIVSEIEGTTRDSIDVHLDIDGYPIIFTDTAGIRETEEFVETEGIKRAINLANNADIVVCLFDASKEDINLFDDIKISDRKKIIFVGNKKDLLNDKQCSLNYGSNVNLISIKDNHGIDDLLKLISDKIKTFFDTKSSNIITRARYRENLKEAVENLDRFSFNKDIELSAEDLRMSARFIGKITGKIEVDELLDKIFGDFCIGK